MFSSMIYSSLLAMQSGGKNRQRGYLVTFPPPACTHVASLHPRDHEDSIPVLVQVFTGVPDSSHLPQRTVPVVHPVGDLQSKQDIALSHPTDQ